MNPMDRLRVVCSHIEPALASQCAGATEAKLPVKLSREVASALAAHRPIVALETTIVSHGMPWPQNLETALEVEAIVREGGATPASIALMNGTVHIGLESEQMRALAQAGEKAIKCSVSGGTAL